MGRNASPFAVLGAMMSARPQAATNTTPTIPIVARRGITVALVLEDVGLAGRYDAGPGRHLSIAHNTLGISNARARRTS